MNLPTVRTFCVPSASPRTPFEVSMARPLLRFVSRLGVIGKLAAIYVLDLLVTASIVVSFIGDKATQIDFSQKELEGTAIFAPARTLYADLLHDFRGAPGSQAALALAFA